MSLEEKARQLAQRKTTQKEVDWPAERDWWLKQLRALHEQVRQWLAPLVGQGLVEIETRPVRLNEENIGAYAAEALILNFSGEAVVLDPQGTLIVGARGRVDVYRRGYRGAQPVMLILGGERDAPVWTIWATRDPATRRPLDEASLRELVDSLL